MVKLPLMLRAVEVGDWEGHQTLGRRKPKSQQCLTAQQALAPGGGHRGSTVGVGGEESCISEASPRPMSRSEGINPRMSPQVPPVYRQDMEAKRGVGAEPEKK